MDFLPPEPQVAKDLAALLVLLADKGTPKYLAELKSATDKYIESKDSLTSKIQELAQKEADLNDGLAKLWADRQESDLRSGTLSLSEDNLKLSKADAEAGKAANKAEAGRLADAWTELKAKEAAITQSHATQMANFVEWEKNLKADIERHNKKVKALKELTYD